MNQLLKFINNLNTAQRAVIIGGFFILFILLISLLVYSNIKVQDKKFKFTIASNLTKNQIMLASNELEASGIPFSVVGMGNVLTLKTSKDFVNIAKIKLVTSEASTNKHVGWEIFEKSSLGTTNFENNVRFLRATEGELARSLESLSGVLNAKVKIAIPKDTIFTQRKIDPTASAVISLRPGVFLTQKQIGGIKNFIASAVPNLKVKNIKLINQDGTLLQMSLDDMDSQKSFVQNKYKQKLERDYEKKIIELLEPVVGLGRVVARVTMELDFKKTHIQEEIYNPEGTVRSQETTQAEKSSNEVKPNSSGTVGVDNNIQEPNGLNTGDTISSKGTSEKNIINYEISKKVVDEKNNNYSQLKKISAAVTFDSSVLEHAKSKDEFLASIESIVKETIAYDKNRGDKIAVRAFKFVITQDFSKQKIDENGNLIPQKQSSVGIFTKIRTVLKEFSEYFQYLIAIILLYVFYRKFIVNHEIVVLPDEEKEQKSHKDANLTDGESTDEFVPNYENKFDVNTAQGRLKQKVKSQIMNNLEGLNEEDAAKHEVLIESLDKEINNNSADVAKMIELLLGEGDAKFKQG